MISYAQNFEDVMLWRALKNVDKGFYVDVGANDPVIDSVTKAFYDAGWRGINIEPVAEWFKKLKVERPEDINIKTAVGDRKGKVHFFEVKGTGLSTMDESFARSHAEEHGFEVKGTKVMASTLASILKKHPSPEVHFLKVDVEGAEEAALRGMDFEKVRPWIVLIESTLPMQQVESYEGWEPLLTDAGYEFVYFDGLNRFYVAKEHAELKESFATPPNCYDSFVMSGTASSSFSNNEAARVGMERLEERLTETLERTQALDAELVGVRAEVAERDKLLHESQARVESLGAELDAARSDVGARDESLHSLGFVLENAEKRCQGLDAELAKHDEKLDALKSALGEAEKRCRGLDAELEGARAEAAERDKLLHESEVRVECLGAELDAARSDVGARDESLHSLGFVLENAEKRCQGLDAELAKHDEKLDALKSALGEAEKRCRGLDAELEGARAEAAERDKLLHESEVRVESLGAELEAAQSDVGARDESLRSLGFVLENAEKRCQGLDAELEAARAGIVERDEKLDALESYLDVAEARAEKLGSELDAARVKIARYDARLAEDAASIENLTGELEALRSHSDELGRANGHLTSEVQRLGNELDAVRAWGEEHARASRYHFAEADARQSMIESLVNSRSWRVTQPLRQVMQAIRKGPVRSAKALGALPANSTGKLLSGAKEFVDNRPGMKVRIKHHLKEHPRLFNGLMHRVAIYRMGAEVATPLPEIGPEPVAAVTAGPAIPAPVAPEPAGPDAPAPRSDAYSPEAYPKDMPSSEPVVAKEPVRQYNAPAQGSTLESKIMEASGKWSLGRRLDD